MDKGKVVLMYCSADNMAVDIMTKPATKFKLYKFDIFIFGAENVRRESRIIYIFFFCLFLLTSLLFAATWEQVGVLMVDNILCPQLLFVQLCY